MKEFKIVKWIDTRTNEELSYKEGIKRIWNTINPDKKVPKYLFENNNGWMHGDRVFFYSNIYNPFHHKLAVMIEDATKENFEYTDAPEWLSVEIE